VVVKFNLHCQQVDLFFFYFCMMFHSPATQMVPVQSDQNFG
jgi:hypothetical protein